MTEEAKPELEQWQIDAAVATVLSAVSVRTIETEKALRNLIKRRTNMPGSGERRLSTALIKLHSVNDVISGVLVSVTERRDIGRAVWVEQHPPPEPAGEPIDVPVKRRDEKAEETP